MLHNVVTRCTDVCLRPTSKESAGGFGSCMSQEMLCCGQWLTCHCDCAFNMWSPSSGVFIVPFLGQMPGCDGPISVVTPLHSLGDGKSEFVPFYEIKSLKGKLFRLEIDVLRIRAINVLGAPGGHGVVGHYCSAVTWRARWLGCRQQ